MLDAPFVGITSFIKISSGATSLSSTFSEYTPSTITSWFPPELLSSFLPTLKSKLTYTFASSFGNIIFVGNVFASAVTSVLELSLFTCAATLSGVISSFLPF